MWNERGDDLGTPAVLQDLGDLTLSADAAEARRTIEAAVRLVLARGEKPLLVGGDHSITYPIVRAFSERAASLAIVHLDAHSDLYPEFQGDRYSHACPFARIAEERLAAHVLQIGVRTLTAQQRAQAAKYGVEIVGAERWRDALPLVARLKSPVYLSLDLDVVEPMLAPGLSHPEPGGLSVRDVLDVFAALRVPLAGADVVEYNPRNDFRDLTARVAAKFVKELAGRLKN
jgi:agmatinase